jgi:hypothetical protein
MTTRRDFLKLGALFVPVVAAPTVAYSFLWARPVNWFDAYAEMAGVPSRFFGETDEQLRKRIEAAWYPGLGELIPTKRSKVVSKGEVKAIVSEAVQRHVDNGYINADWADHLVIKGAIR